MKFPASKDCSIRCHQRSQHTSRQTIRTKDVFRSLLWVRHPWRHVGEVRTCQIEVKFLKASHHVIASWPKAKFLQLLMSTGSSSKLEVPACLLYNGIPPLRPPLRKQKIAMCSTGPSLGSSHAFPPFLAKGYTRVGDISLNLNMWCKAPRIGRSCLPSWSLVAYNTMDAKATITHCIII